MAEGRITLTPSLTATPKPDVKRREDARSELRRTPPVDEPQHGVQVDVAVPGELGSHVATEPGSEESIATPPDDRSGARAWAGCGCA